MISHLYCIRIATTYNKWGYQRNLIYFMQQWESKPYIRDRVRWMVPLSSYCLISPSQEQKISAYAIHRKNKPSSG